MPTVSRQAHYVNPMPAAPQAQPSQIGVPAEGTQLTLLSNSTLLRLSYLSAGTPPPLRGTGQLLKQWDGLYTALRVLLGSPKRAEMVKEALWLQAMTGECFAGARYLASRGLGSEKTWDRTLAWLRIRGLARTSRLYRANGQQSTNLLDLSRLWAVVRKILSRLGLVERHGRRLWVRVGAGWLSQDELLDLASSCLITNSRASALPL